MRSLRSGLTLVLACVLLATGCTSLQGTNDNGFIAGDQTIRVIDPDDRSGPVEFEGTSLTGEKIRSADYEGTVLVVNKWWSGCTPCIKEMPMLVNAAEELGDRAAFLGINIRDASADQGLAFMRSVGADYPSIWDVQGRAVLAFSGKAPMAAVPTTVVLDREGRVAAIVAGAISGERTFIDVVDQIASEPADG